jgi:hypothetical protein
MCQKICTEPHCQYKSAVTLYQNTRLTGQQNFLELCPRAITEVQQTFPIEWEARGRYCRWFQESVANGFPDIELVSLSDEAWFTLN